MRNLNLGILGHVDAGKTSLVRALSTTLSTASLDKHPQSKERGITLDLGFSSLSAGDTQITLVDCPGHASLLRTVIGGAQIIDAVVLVVDATKGIQPQTAECIVLAEAVVDVMVVALNKMDMFPEKERAQKIDKVIKGLQKVFKSTSFPSAPIVPISASPGASGNAEGAGGIRELIDTVLKNAPSPRPDPLESDKFLFLFDHCFTVKGTGTVATGTVLSGKIRINDTVEVCHTKEETKIKSIQVFRKSVETAKKGDRAGLALAKADAKKMERGIIATPSSVLSLTRFVARVSRVRFYKGSILSRKTKLHFSFGHETSIGTAVFFRSLELSPGVQPIKPAQDQAKFQVKSDYMFVDELSSEMADGQPPHVQPSSAEGSAGGHYAVYALVELEAPLFCPPDAMFIASRLDLEGVAKQCRLALVGKVLSPVDQSGGDRILQRSALRIFRSKEKPFDIVGVPDDNTIMGAGLSQKKKTDISAFIGMEALVVEDNDEEREEGENKESDRRGIVDSLFGTSGKFKVAFKEPHGIPLSKGKAKPPESLRGIIRFRKYIFDDTKSMVQ